MRSGREVWSLGQSCLLSWPRSREVGRVWLSWQWCPEAAVREPFTGRWAGASGESMVPHKVGRRQGWVLSCGEWRSGVCGRLRSLQTGLAGKGVRWRGVGERGQEGWVRFGQTRAGGWRGMGLGCGRPPRRALFLLIPKLACFLLSPPVFRNTPLSLLSGLGSGGRGTL